MISAPSFTTTSSAFRVTEPTGAEVISDPPLLKLSDFTFQKEPS